jgi:hypothetical protein
LQHQYRSLSDAAALLATGTLLIALSGCAPSTNGSGVPQDLQGSANAAIEQDSVPSIEAPQAKVDVPRYTADLDTLAAQKPPAPVRLTAASAGIDMDVTDVGLLSDGTLEIPDRAAVAGWYRAMAAPGEDDGIALLAAHVDDPDGLGPFAALKDISEGAEVDVELEDGQNVTYRVSAIEETSKETVDFERILDGSLGHHLVLVTCGGEFDWDTRHYENNVIVWAERVDD